MTSLVRISFCVCTADRLPELRRCLESFARSSVPVEEVVVADDSRDAGSVQALCARYPFVRYVQGPRRGLWANRNTAVRASTGEWLAFLDDDGVLGADFVRVANELLASAGPRTILTGNIDEPGRGRIRPVNLSFLGFFDTPPMGRLKTVNINSCVFPRDAFHEVSFDETLVYGQGDADVCTRLIALGYQIRYEPKLLNGHIPPAQTADAAAARERVRELARFYMSLKRHFLWEQRPLLGALYVPVATGHQMLHHAKHRRFREAVCVPLHMLLALRLAARYARFLSRGDARGVLPLRAAGATRPS